MRRIYIFGAIAIALGAAAFVALPFGGASDASYRTEAASRGNVVQMISANGTLKPVKVVNVGAQVSGRIKTLYADFNDKVTEGQVLAELDDSLLRAQLAQSEANLASAEADKSLADATVARQRELVKTGAVSQAAVDTAVAQAQVAAAAVAARRAAVELDRVNVGYAVIKSPVSGVVMSRDVDEGQTVAASLSAPQLFSIAQDLAQMQIDTTVAEADVGAITTGMDATFRVDAFPGRQFTGKVRQVRLNATTESNVVSYNVVLDVQNADLTLLPGMTAYVQITTAQSGETLRVANAALRFKPAGAEGTGERRRRSGGGDQTAASADTRTVYVLDGGTPRAVSVTTGISDGKVTSVSGEGLNEGDPVIIGLAAPEAPAAANTGGRRMGGPMF